MDDLLRHHRTDDDDYVSVTATQATAPALNVRPRSVFSPRGQNPGAQVRRDLNISDDFDGTTLPRDDYADNQFLSDIEEDSTVIELHPRRADAQRRNDAPRGDIPAQAPPTTTPTVNTSPLTTNPPACASSGICTAIHRLMADTPSNTLAIDLLWQQQVEGDPLKIKAFRTEVLQQVDLVVFAYMRPASPFVHLLHSAAPFSVPSGDIHYRGKDIGFVGDRTDVRVPTPIVLAPEQPWKWISRRIVMDIGPLDAFYAQEGNATKLFHPPDRTGEQMCTSPRLLAIPPHFIHFCVTGQRTPYHLHNYIATFATEPDSPITLDQCQCMLTWCLMASHHDTNAASSILSFTMEPAISTDDAFNRWLQRRLANTLGHPPSTPAPFSVPHGLPPTAPQVLPPPDMWNQFTTNLTQGIANAAAALQPLPRPATFGDNTASEDGGKFYDSYQLAVIQGFSNSPSVAGIQPIWALFQHTKHLDTHRDNLKRKMIAWAEAQRRHVAIDRGLYIPNASLREILSLRFNPGGAAAEVSTADQGISLLMCRARSTETKASIRRREQIEQKMSMASLSFSDAEKTIERDTATCPEDYNELLRCLGTFCALLHSLFGSRCSFFNQCAKLLRTLDSEYVYDRRRFFTPLFCRQLVWAMVEEGREYFSHRMSPTDFEGVHPDDVEYPETNIIELLPHIRNQTPLVRSSFPAQWLTTAGGHATAAAHGGESVQHTLLHQAPPVQSIRTPVGAPPSVISGVSTVTSPTAQLQGQIRATNIHPMIKALMTPYIQKFRSVRLNQLLDSINLTIADLPALPSLATADTTICYNFVLGNCVHSACLHKHVDAAEVTDDFATKLTTMLAPAVTTFLNNGAPLMQRRKRRRRAE